MLIQNDDAAPGNNQGGGYAKTLFSLGIVSFLIKIAGRISKYLMILLISRYIGVDALGLFVLCITIMSMLSVVSMMGLNTLLLKYVAEFTTKQQFDLARLAYKRAVSLACPMGIAVSLGLYTCSPFVASTIFGKPAMEPYLEIISMGILPFILLNLSFQSLRGMRRIWEFAMLEDFFIPSATTILLLPIIFDTDLYQEHVVAYMISIWLAMGTGVFLWYKNIRKVTVRCQDGEKQGDNKSLLRLSFKNMLSKAMPMMFVTTLGMVMIWTDTLMLGVLKNEHEVGIYNVAFRLSQILPLPLIAVNSIAAPMIAAYYGKKEMENLASVAQKASNMILMVATPIFIFFLLFPKMLLGLFGPQFLGGTNAFLMLIIGQFVNALTGPVGVILTMTGKQVQLRNIIFLAICMNIILNFILIPEFGINGAAFASMTSAFILHLTPFLLVKKYYGFYTIGLSARRTRRKNE